MHCRSRSTSARGNSHLGAQLTGAVDSIKDNIAEGCGAATNKEFARFLDMSVKSANETEGRLRSTRDLDLFSSEEWRKFNDETIEIRKMVYTYREKVLETPDDE